MDISLLALRSSVDLSQSISFFNDCKRTSGTRQSNNWIAVDAIRREYELVHSSRRTSLEIISILYSRGGVINLINNSKIESDVSRKRITLSDRIIKRVYVF